MIQSLQDKAEKFFSRMQTVGAAAIDPATLALFFSTIVTFIRGCTDQATAKAEIKKGGPVSMGVAMKTVRKTTDLRGPALRQRAYELTQEGASLSDEELNDLVSNAANVPSESSPTGVWPMILAFTALLLFSATAQAQEGVWPIDEVQNQRLDKLEGEAAKIQSSFQALNAKIDTLIQKSVPVASPAVAAQEAELDEISAALSRMNKSITKLEAGSLPQKQPGRNIQPLYNHSPAFMADSSGNLLNTTDQHLLDHGYTRQEISGLTSQQKNSLHGAAHAGHIPQSGRVLAANAGSSHSTVTVSRAVTYQASGECNGRRCNRIRRRG